jgi:N-acetylmuramoyl-L-alanine amidase
MHLRATLPLILALLLLGMAAIRPASSNNPASAQRAPGVPARRSASAAEAGPASAAQRERVPAQPTAAPQLARVASVPAPAPQPWRVGLQVGHWRLEGRPAELEKVYGSSTGYGDINEVDLNLDIARRVQARLEAAGVIVDLLPATVPPGYLANAFIAFHADGDSSPESPRRGWKSAPPWRASRASQDLNAALAATYGPATELPFDWVGITLDMRGYYAFNYHRFHHAIAPTTPAVIIELGFMNSAEDRTILLDQPDRAAAGVADGVLRYLRERDPADLAALQPLDLPTLRPRASLALRDQPDSVADAVATLDSEQRLVPYRQQDDWYLVAVRGDWGLTGWVRQDQVLAIALPAEEVELCLAARAGGC